MSEEYEMTYRTPDSESHKLRVLGDNWKDARREAEAAMPPDGELWFGRNAKGRVTSYAAAQLAQMRARGEAVKAEQAKWHDEPVMREGRLIRGARELGFDVKLFRGKYRVTDRRDASVSRYDSLEAAEAWFAGFGS